MQTIIKLNCTDIREIIAKHFETDIGNVDLVTDRISVGYGRAEHDEYMPAATINVAEKKC